MEDILKLDHEDDKDTSEILVPEEDEDEYRVFIPSAQVLKPVVPPGMRMTARQLHLLPACIRRPCANSRLNTIPE